MLRLFSNLFALAWLSLLTAAVIEAHRAPAWAVNLPSPAEPIPPPPNLMERMEQGLFKRNAPLVLTETEINRYLNAHLAAQDSGSLAKSRQIRHYDVQCLPGGFEIRLLWRGSHPHPSTATLQFTLRRQGNQFIIEPTTGTYGRLTVPRGFMSPLVPALQSLAQALKPEIDTAFQMNQIRFEQDQLVLDPRVEIAR